VTEIIFAMENAMENPENEYNEVSAPSD